MTKPVYYCKSKACDWQMHAVIGPLQVSTLGLYDDVRFPGRSVLALDEHHVDFTDISDELAQAFLVDIRRAAKAIQRVTGCDRMNYAIMGNHEPHVHAHLIPRVRDCPVARKPPWTHPDPPRPLPPQRRIELIAQIEAALRD
jgi:diadenosine tetraphosphate (Ap4A) HIT family hydrolase